MRQTNIIEPSSESGQATVVTGAWDQRTGSLMRFVLQSYVPILTLSHIKLETEKANSMLEVSCQQSNGFVIKL